MLDGRSSFAEAVAAAGASLAPPSLAFNLALRQVTADGQLVSLPPAPFAFYAALASRRLRGKAPLPAPLRDAHDPAWAASLLDELRHLYGSMNVPDSIESMLLAPEVSGAQVSPMISRLRKALRDALAPGRLLHYFDDGGSHRNKRYSVPLPPAAIVLRGSGSRAPARATTQQRDGKLAKRAAGAIAPDTPRAPDDSAPGGQR